MKSFIYFVVFILIINPVLSLNKSVCLTGTESVYESHLSALGLNVYTSCTTDFANYNLVFEMRSFPSAGVRSAAVPVVIVKDSALEWKFSDGIDVENAELQLFDGSGNQSSLNTGLPANPKVYTSVGQIWHASDNENPATPLTSNDAYYTRLTKQIASFWWDPSDSDQDNVKYEQRGVKFGLSDTGLYNDNASRLFNNSVKLACPYCFDDCSPPLSANWGINKTCNLKNKDINITGNVSIFDNGFLNLTGSGGYLNFIGTNRFIFMYPGSELSLDISATIGKDPI